MIFKSKKPEYHFESVALEGADCDFKFAVELVGKGMFNGVVVGFTSFDSVTPGQLSVTYSIVSLPEPMYKHKADIERKVGKVNQKLCSQIDSITSLLIAEVTQELNASVPRT